MSLFDIRLSGWSLIGSSSQFLVANLKPDVTPALQHVHLSFALTPEI